LNLLRFEIEIDKCSLTADTRWSTTCNPTSTPLLFKGFERSVNCYYDVIVSSPWWVYC